MIQREREMYVSHFHHIITHCLTHTLRFALARSSVPSCPCLLVFPFITTLNVIFLDYLVIMPDFEHGDLHPQNHSVCRHNLQQHRLRVNVVLKLLDFFLLIFDFFSLASLKFKLGWCYKHTVLLMVLAETCCQQDSSEYFTAIWIESFHRVLLVFDSV